MVPKIPLGPFHQEEVQEVKGGAVRRCVCNMAVLPKGLDARCPTRQTKTDAIKPHSEILRQDGRPGNRFRLAKRERVIDEDLTGV